MIKSIHMRNCATYSVDGADILNCKKINFFYGANGSGKSTIASFLRNQKEPRFTECSLEWENDECQDIFVYNRNFRESNLRESDIEGVFTLGEATIEEIKELDNLKAELEQKREKVNTTTISIAKQKEKSEKAVADLKENLWKAIYKQHGNQFVGAFDKYSRSKEKFYLETRRRIGLKRTNAETIDSLLKRAETLLSSTPDFCEKIEIEIGEYQDQVKRIREDSIWEKVIIGNKDVPLAKLITLLNNSDWVSAGRKYIGESKLCPFCQRETITDDYRAQLEAFFDEEYRNDIVYISKLSDEYEDLVRKIEDLLVSTMQDEKVFAIAGIERAAFEVKISALKQLFSDSVMRINEKKKQPGERIELLDEGTILSEILGIIRIGNGEIDKHNLLVRNFNEEKEKLINDIWTYCISEQKTLIESADKDIENIQKSIEGMIKAVNEGRNRIKELEEEIEEKGKNVTSVQPTVNEINRSLRAYGFTNFHIVPSVEKENHYQIQRDDGSLVSNTLSEGEETFISFLYFMQLSKGAVDVSKVLRKRIIVLDDPVCSLDSMILYIVSTMVQGLSMDIRKGEGDVSQLFVFTHNVFFHKEASFIDGRTKTSPDVNYWIIKKDLDISNIVSYDMGNPISTTYELLWRELRNNESSSMIALQNSMRRIIENYFNMVGGNKGEYIIDQFDTLEDKIVCRSLFSWINDGSHSIPDDLYIDSYSGSAERYNRVFMEIFRKTGHIAHYNMMMGIEDEVC